jgi:hypothetical protein
MNNKTPFKDKIEKPEIENDTRNQTEREVEDDRADKPEIGKESNWSRDQQEKSYYYDDSHGYQKYVPADDSEEE